MWVVNIHQDIDEQYARRLRPGTRLGLLDPALLREMFVRYALGMRAAKFVPHPIKVSKLNRFMEQYNPDGEWVGMPCWIARWCLRRQSRPLAARPEVGLSNMVTWTLHRYRVFAESDLVARTEFWWYDVDRNVVGYQHLPIWANLHVDGGAITDGSVVYRFEFA